MDITVHRIPTKKKTKKKQQQQKKKKKKKKKISAVYTAVKHNPMLFFDFHIFSFVQPRYPVTPLNTTFYVHRHRSHYDH